MVFILTFAKKYINNMIRNSRTLLSMLSIVLLFASFGCKKSNNAQSAVGKWKLSNYAGTTVSNTSSSNGYTNTYSFVNATGTLTQTETAIGSSTPYVFVTQITTETWSINNDGTYSISEVYTPTGGTQITSTTSGTWDYLSNSKANNEIVFSGNGSYALGSPSFLTISSVSGSELVLTSVSSTTDNTGRTSSTNLTMTFTKM